jgi:hypothetical protein
MLLRTKILIIILVVLLIGLGAGIYFLFTGGSYETVLPEAVEQETFAYPYTGLKTADKKATTMRPLCVKIPNDVNARPQTNINKADVVYETMVEGGETRLNAIFQSNVPKEVGPVRSARLSDVWIVPQYNGMLFFSGANSQVRGEIEANNISDMRWSYAESIYFRANNGRGDMHNLHINLDKSYEVAKKRGYEVSSSTLKPLHFMGVRYDGSESTGAASKLNAIEDNGTTAAAVQIDISGNAHLNFKWNKDENKYYKWINGNKHMDVVDDKQVNVTNVVVLWADYVTQAKEDAAGSATYDTVLGGTGKAVIFKNGKRYNCQWKADKNTPPRFYDKNGDELFLDPGNSWFAVPPIGENVLSE